MTVIITPLTGNGEPSPLLKKIMLPGHGHIVEADGSDEFFVDVFGLPPEITNYTVDLINSDLERVGADGACRACKGACPCCPASSTITTDGEQAQPAPKL